MKPNDPSNKSPLTDANKGEEYKPSKEFLQYLILAQTAQVECHENKWSAVNEHRDEITKTIARRPARNLCDIFEKLYIWRMESFDPSDDDFIYFDDLFPLSAYYDVKRLINFDCASPDMDDLYEEMLRTCKSFSEEKAQRVAEKVVPLFRNESE